MRRRQLMIPLALALSLTVLVPGSALGKAHVPADQVQLSHKGRKAINVDAPALKAHIRHGDVQLPACDFANVFGEGADTSNVVSTSLDGVLYADGTFIARMPATTDACPPGTF